MSILVIDHIIERKLAIESVLSRAGLLLTEARQSNFTGTYEKVSMSSLVIINSEPDDIEWSNQKWSELIRNIVVIGPESIVKNKEAKQILLYPGIDDSADELALEKMMNVVMSYMYREIYPITLDTRMQAMLKVAKRAAKSTASILIEGETGTGKEVIAKYIHHHSQNANGPFIAVNCAAIPETMIEAVLFGYEKGAFTNAINSYVGKFEQANNGTLFLDEIAEMSTDMQAKLLRVLQESEFERIGGRLTKKINVRIIAATNQNLELELNKGSFRADLYYRLNVVNLKCTPLRQRQSDIACLAEYFMMLFSQQLGKIGCEIDADATEYLEKYTWPGNIRELQNIIHRAVIMDEDNIIDVADLGYILANTSQQEASMSSSLRAKEAETIVNVLKETKGCRSDAARRLMISPRTLRHKILKLREIGHDVP
jgi:two-component system response regulator FlrC